MAFLTPTILPSKFSTRTRNLSSLNNTPTATASNPNQPTIKTTPKRNSTLPSQKPRTRTPAPVIDSRVSSVRETHHWIVVKNQSQRIFERAAVAQSDTTSRLEARLDTAPLHRWLLQEIPDPTLGFLDTSMRDKDARYVVMEAFDAKIAKKNPSVSRRWLSAVERLAPVVDAVGMASLSYDNVFTSKLHAVDFDPNENVVVVESVNVDMSRSSNLSEVAEILRSSAEFSVSTGDCLEFCVLHSQSEQGFFKTIEVYKNVEALKNHMEGLDRPFMRRLQGRVSQGHRSRHTFRPVVFA